jgi:glycosyltransferase involved in cell wall biosynthesis
MLAAAGAGCERRRVQTGLAHRARRTLAMVDLVEALAARHAAATISAPAVIYSSITAALLQPAGRVYAVRFDTLAAQSRPGITGLWQRRREPAVLRGARLLLPWSEAAAETARRLLSAHHGTAGPRIVTLPVPIEPLAGSPARDIDAVAYCADPRKRGLELLCAAWDAARPAGGELEIAGIDRARGLAHLAAAGQGEPPGTRWLGDLARERWLEHVGRARIFLNASRYEDWGIGQLEALSAGTPLVTVPSAGPNEALALARELDPGLVAGRIAAPELAAAIRAGLALTDAERAAYGARADAALAPYRPERLRRIVADEVLPALLSAP